MSNIPDTPDELDQRIIYGRFKNKDYGNMTFKDTMRLHKILWKKNEGWYRLRIIGAALRLIVFAYWTFLFTRSAILIGMKMPMEMLLMMIGAVIMWDYTRRLRK